MLSTHGYFSISVLEKKVLTAAAGKICKRLSRDAFSFYEAEKSNTSAGNSCWCIL